MNSWTWTATSLADTDRLGTALAQVLPAGTTVALSGTLGAGKTRLVQAIAAACGIPRDEVVSPTFVLCQEYHGSHLIYHLDAYRLSGPGEFEQLGPEELFRSQGLVFIEWAERVQSSLPPERMEIVISTRDDEQRDFTVRAHGQRLASVIEGLKALLS